MKIRLGKSGVTMLVLPVLFACAGTSDEVVSPQPAVASVIVSPLPAQMVAGDVAQLTATAWDARHTPVTARPIVWTSSDSLVASVSATGRVTVVGHGTVAITASVDGKVAAVTTSAVLTRKERRLAYTVVAHDAPASGPSLPNASENATGGGISVAHPTLGDYSVVFDRLARADSSWRETVMLSMRSGGMATHCHVNDWWTAANRRDLEVSVSCYGVDNRKTAGSFALLVIGGGSLEGRHSFIYNADSSQSNTPSASAVFNSSGHAIAISRAASGSYRVDVNNPRALVPENYFITTFGNPAATCVLGSWSYGNSAGASCVGPDATADRRFAMQLIEGGRPGRKYGFAWASVPNPPLGSEYVPSLTYQRMSNGRQVAVARDGVANGSYSVRFPGFGTLLGERHTIQVSPYASGRVSCAVSGENAVNDGADLTVHVFCYDRYSGVPTNAHFTILALE